MNDIFRLKTTQNRHILIKLERQIEALDSLMVITTDQLLRRQKKNFRSAGTDHAVRH